MNLLRTPEDRFLDLPGYPFAPRYLEDLDAAQGARVHYLDEGPADANVTWLCLHGEPTWSYLYRKMIPVFTAIGHRVIAPDFVGFGKSDKFEADSAYHFHFHRDMLLELIERLDLTGLRLVCQDWGGLLGLTLPMALPERFEGLLVMNTAFNTGDMTLGKGFLAWREFARQNPDLDVAGLMKRSTPVLSDEEAAAYASPFPDVRYKAGVRRFPDMVAETPDADGAALSREARDWWQAHWTGRSFMAIGMQDPVLGPAAMNYLHTLIPNCPPPMEISEGGHFVQEWGEPIAREAVRVLAGR